MSVPSEQFEIDITHRQGDFTLAVRGALNPDGITALTGPSGAGKTTLLRVLAGLLRPARGTVRRGEAVWTDTVRRIHLPPHKRPVGLMFQDNRLFSHLTVEGNLRFANQRRPRPQKGPDWAAVVDALELSPLLHRQPGTLSGGEQRRVALARTLLTGPDLLLLDEPLTGLDRARKRNILTHIERIHRRFALPILYVSHDLADIARLSDTVWVMADGRLRQSGPTADVLNAGSALDVGTNGARLTATVSAHDEMRGLTRLTAEGQALDAPLDTSVSVGATLHLWIRAQDVAIALARPDGISIRNAIPVTLQAIVPDPGGHDAMLGLQFGRQTLKARISAASVSDLALEPGQALYALLKTVRLEDGGL